jgi:hypothetical protein
LLKKEYQILYCNVFISCFKWSRYRW